MDCPFWGWPIPPPAAAGNQKICYQVLGSLHRLRRWERDQWLDIWCTFTCTHELLKITSRGIMTLVSRGNCRSNLKLNLPICDLAYKKTPGEPWLWLYWVWCNGVTNSSACTQFLLPASHDARSINETRYACSFCKRKIIKTTVCTHIAHWHNPEYCSYEWPYPGCYILGKYGLINIREW